MNAEKKREYTTGLYRLKDEKILKFHGTSNSDLWEDGGGISWKHWQGDSKRGGSKPHGQLELLVPLEYLT